MYHRSTSVTPLPGYRLAVTFDDGTSGVVDLADRVHRLPTGVFAELQDPARFAQVFIDPEGGHLAWPNGADVDPYLLYDEAHSSLSR